MPFVLWSYETTSSTSIGKSIITLAFRIEVVIPVKIGTPTYQIQYFNPVINKELQCQSLDLLEEKRDQAMNKLVAYRVKQLVNTMLRSKSDGLELGLCSKKGFT